MTSVAISQTVPEDSTRGELRDLYRILLLRGNGSEFLAGNGHPVVLPCLEIPRWERVAEHLTIALQKRYGLGGVCLFAPDLSARTTDSGQPLYQVMHSRRADYQEPEGTRWLAVDTASESSFADRQDRIALTHAIRQLCEFRERRVHGPFGDPAWIDELLVWAQRELDAYGHRLTGEFQQFNASPTFALLRLKTNGAAVWFKAVGEPNIREFEISVTLSNLFSGFVPTVIAARPDWHGWLTLEFDGSTLERVSDPSAWRRAVSTLAELQIVTTEHARDLLQAGCRDLRVPSLLTLVDPFIETMILLMKRQSKTPPSVLGEAEIRVLAKQIKDALLELAETNIPDSLGHLDFNPGNILCSADQCIFLDWAEAYVGPPFLTFQYLLEHLSHSTERDAIGSEGLGDHYFSRWLCRIPGKAVSAAQTLMPLAAVFACATATDWATARDSQDERFVGYLRSLTRRMQREARTLDANRVHPRVGR